MSARRVVVLWEDMRGPTKGFGPHKLLLAAVHDVADGAWPRLEKLVVGHTMNSNTKVLAAVKDDFGDLTRRGERVVAVFDEDRVRTLLGLPGSTPEDAVIAAITRSCPEPALLSVILLHRNVETLLDATRDCSNPAEIDPGLIARARDKDRAARDAVLVAVARQALRHVRDCILEKSPSFAALRNAVVAAAGTIPTS